MIYLSTSSIRNAGKRRVLCRNMHREVEQVKATHRNANEYGLGAVQSIVRLQREVPVTARRYDERSSTGKGRSSDVSIKKGGTAILSPFLFT